ncbi:MAG TPA: hypothetical protein VG847_15475, partial [Chitinophagaceae bacterium]|nr:hypothetical protein [Chitinophagaceae bacterium]
MFKLQNYSNRVLFIFIANLLFFCEAANSQNIHAAPYDSIYPKNNVDTFTEHTIYPYNKKRVRLVTAANILGYGGALVGLNAEWYAHYPRSGFHFFNDDAEWL